MSDTSLPSIRTFQMDASTVGVLKSSVNLFRGDVNLTQSLFSMPGRNDNDGLQIDVSIQYQSNINLDAMTWNRERPTGVLGLGWELPLSLISYDDQGSPLPGAGIYSISLAGVSSQLAQEPDTPFLFAMDQALASSLQNGAQIPPAVRSEFVKRGLPLSPNSVLQGGAGSWLVQDDGQEQLFQLKQQNGALNAYDGGVSFQLVNYKFWKVLYYSQYERWLVINETGQRMSFGGGLGYTAQQYRSSAGNSIEWAVQWCDANGVALWDGDSAQSAGQRQVARAWRLRRTFSRFGESVSYGYNEFARDANGLLTHGAEQLVGAGGKPYTKACYLTSVTDVFGRRASFMYADKLWSNASPSSPREYSDPHKAVPDTTPNGFQDRYETQYLQSILVSHTDGATLFGLNFDYDPSPGAGSASASAVANVAGDSGDTAKRYLSGFALHNPAGYSLPGFRYHYYLDKQQNTNLGALNSITYPTGGVTSYAYRSAVLDICQRELPSQAPAPLPQQSIARVWFGPDYAVLTWNNTGSQMLSLQIFTWNGAWNMWQPATDSPLILQGNGGTDSSSLNVLTGADFVGVVYDTSQNTNLHLFRKDPARRAQWVAAQIAGGGSGGCNSPTWSWSKANGKVSTYAGRRYVLATQMNSSQNKGAYDVFTWDWPSQSWNHSTQATPTYAWFAASNDYYVSIDTAAKLSLQHLPPTGSWQSGGVQQLGFSVSNLTSLALAANLSTVAVSHFISGGASIAQQSYDVFLLQIKGDFSFTPAVKFSFTDKFDKSYPTSWSPSVVTNGLVAVAGNLMRFDGHQWLVNSNLKPNSGSVYGQQRYAYGPDFATLILVNGNTVSGKLLGYDANNASGVWDTQPTAINGLSVPSVNQSSANWVAAGNPDYLSIGTQLYFRGVASNWQNAIGQSIADMQTLINQAAGTSNRYQLNSASVINQGPGFIACAVYDTQGPAGSASASSALLLRNGAVYGPASLLPGQKMWTSQENDRGASGLYPGGPAAFYTYPDSVNNLDGATRVYLHRYAAYAIAGPISDWPVAAISIDDGLSEAFSSSYVQDQSNAACDASGEVVKYYKSTVYAGGSPENPVNGSVVSTYLNGADTDLADYYDMLDGLLQSVQCYDRNGVQIASSTSFWQGFVKRAADPNNGALTPQQLYGAYVLKLRQDNQSDGVLSSQITSYTPGNLQYTYTGQPASVSQTTVNGGGQTEQDVQSNVYACEVNPVSRVLNDVASSVQLSVSNAGVITSSSVTALAPTATVWGSDVLTPAEEADFGWTGGSASFPFATYQAGANPENWQVTTRNLLRAPNGAVLQQQDGAGTVCSTIFAQTLGFPLATFKNATLAECAFNSFQSYQDQSSWRSSGVSVNTEQAWFGEQSLNLPKGAQLSTSVTPGAGRSSYLLGVRYQTPAGFDSGSSAISVNIAGQVTNLPWADTQGEWQYMTAVFGVPAGAASATLSMQNSGNATVLLDSVLFVPFGTDVTAQSWYHDTRLLRASMSAGGNTNFTLYDNFNRPLGAVGADNRLQELDVRFLSRQGNPQSVFDDASPNAELTLHFAEGGSAETFRDGGAWAQRWQPGQPALWSTQNGILHKNSSTPDSLSWRGETDSVAAYLIEFTPQGALSGAVSISFGGNQEISWTPGQGWAWRAAGQSVQNPLAQAPAMAQQWLLVLGNAQALFFADGQLLFSHASSATPAQGFAFNSGPNALQIQNLIQGDMPRLGLSYTDGAGRQRQVQQQWGQDSRVMAIIYDALDRQIAATRCAPGDFGSGAAAPALQYRPGFVDVGAFLAAQANTWAMRGDVADYYAGQRDGPIVRPNDQGYPYSGLRYEASAQNRIVESGKPGLQLSIHDVNSTTPAQRQTTRTNYGMSTSADPLPAGQYYATNTTTPSGYQARQLVDKDQRAVANMQFDQAGQNVGQSIAAPSYSAQSGSAGTLGTMHLPNAYGNGPQQNPAAFVRTTLQNPLGQASHYSDPDTGATQYLFNGKGQQRFVQVPLQAGEQYFLYSSYDALGRIVEEGIVQAAWNAAALQEQADNPDYPTAADGAVISRRYAYNGDGSQPNNLDRLIRCTTYNQAPASAGASGPITVEESWQYDVLGRVTQASMTVSGSASLQATARYYYNNLNEIVRIDLPEGSPLPSITYSYNDQGQITGIGIPGQAQAIASYVWNADGQLQSATRGALAEVWNYDSPGNILQHSVSVQGNLLLAHDFSYNPDSQIQSRQTTVGFNGAAKDCTVQYQYDGQQRFSRATASDSQPGNQSVSQYDANGNIYSASQDGQSLSAQMKPGTDQLASATLPDGSQASFSYRADGRPSAWRGLQMEYDAGLGIVSCVVNGASQVRYARGMNNQRIVRQQGSSQELRFVGAGNTPLMIWRDGRAQLCIWGPTGLAAVHDGALRYPIADHQQTVWAVADSAGQVVASFNYLPFGGLLAQDGPEAQSWQFKYAGKSWDPALGLYDFGARLYDPALLRFTAPDPVRQFASPYVFASNNPMNMVDPSGNISVWAQVGIGIAMVAVAIAGIALGIATGGAAAPVAGAAEAALVGAEVGGEAAVVGAAVAGEGAAAGAAGAAGAAELAVDGVAAGAGEVAAGAAAAGEAAAPLTTAQVVGQNLASIGWSALSSAITGAGTGGLSYDIQHGRDFTAKGFFTAMGVGALSGAVSGGVGGLASMPATVGLTQGMSITATVAFRALTQATASMIGSDLATLLSDAITGQKVTAGQLLLSSAQGFGMGALSGAKSGLGQIKPESVAVSASDRALVRVSTSLDSAIESAKSAATSQAAIAAYIAGGFFLVSGYTVWGVYEGSKSSS
ncbi:RHS repeat-associated core domain-containing protein [Massilia sp. W12]|uniref:RHS repeat domain-containing protein n=1 Tax=Massilia sp. W12 TaxID=3126507 RepID=UPI0030D0C98B